MNPRAAPGLHPGSESFQGGRFSNVPVPTGEPRLAAGTFGGRAVRTGPDDPADDPFRIRYLGSFVAGKQ